jgi:phosphoglycerate kinase
MTQTTNNGLISENYSQLATWDLAGKRVLLRADLNIPLKNGIILDTYKLQALQPTIDLILKKGGKITLLTHIGRPEKPTPELSSRHLIAWFVQQGYDIKFAQNPTQAAALSAPIILLENTRFFPGECQQEKDSYTNLKTSLKTGTCRAHQEKERSAFARELAQLGDYYVNDAFGALHRTDSSITDLAYQFPPEKRTFGLLVERELHNLNKILHNPKKPFVLIVGGAKVSEKIPLINQLLPLIDTLILCPAIAFTFAYALGKKVGISLVDHDSVAMCKKIIDTAREKNIKIILPLDYLIAYQASLASKNQDIIEELNHGNYKNRLEIVNAESLPENGLGVSIGPKTIAAYEPILKKAGTVLFNGAMGFAQQPETIQTMRELLQLIHTAPGQRVITGGDSVGMVMQLGMQNCFDYLSTGGGAALCYLSGQQLPGLIPFNL